MNIVLQHGLFGFRPRYFGCAKIEYFPGITDMLIKQGHKVLCTGANPIGGIEQRAVDLRNDLKGFPAPFVIIAHSMGGLDARQMLAIASADLAANVAAVVTIATPHQGSPIADFVCKVCALTGVSRLSHALNGVRDRLLQQAVRLVPELQGVAEGWLGWMTSDHDAVSNLTTDYCRGFNARTPNAANVKYFYISTKCPPDQVPVFFHFSHRYIRDAQLPGGGENDGMVSIASSRPPDGLEWESLGTWEVDHLTAVNQCLPRQNDVLERYAQLVKCLADRGIAT